MCKIPTKVEIAEQIKSLLDGKKPPEEVSAWACIYTLNDDIDIEDEQVWDLLKCLVLSDAMTGEGYLYGEIDFEEWLKLCEE